MLSDFLTSYIKLMAKNKIYQFITEMYNHVILKVIMITIMITLNFKIMIMIKIMIIRKIQFNRL